MMKTEEPYKKCTKCGRVLPLSSFYKDSRVKDGHASICKNCHNLHHRTQEMNLKGEKYKIPDSLKNVSEMEIIGDLYDTEKVVHYSIDDLLKELKVNIDQYMDSIEMLLDIHKDILADEKSRTKVLQELTELLQSKINSICKEKK